ncbi:MAG: hypothetical protein M1812_000098 [Candelaria pacifica]|nr:MAG: hypothetical protein M1812_000098 [Candelaria pacifica]
MFNLPFTTSRFQTSTYLLGVCLFSISFLVFLNASVSFVITDVLHIHDRIGDAVGTLGFADELLALVACPVWGMLSDRIGVRTVCVLGYGIVGLALFVFVQAKNVYPQLLLARLFFSLGGAAVSTMVTAILPSMTSHATSSQSSHNGSASPRHAPSPSDSSQLTITPARLMSQPPQQAQGSQVQTKRFTASFLASEGLVGMFTGCGALVALVIFLPLPARLQRSGTMADQAIQDTYYIVGAIALIVAICCFFGLRGLEGEESKGWGAVFGRKTADRDSPSAKQRILPYWRLLARSITLGFKDTDIGLGYLGGFVARASSVGISLFIPLYVNTYFISSGLCTGQPGKGSDEMKRQCRRAYVLSAELTGISQLVALLFAPVFGFLSHKFRRFNAPLLASAMVGIVGYVALALTKSPEPSGENGNPAIFVTVILLGISQIGAIVCSLGQLSRGVLGNKVENRDVSIIRDNESPGDNDNDNDSNDASCPSTESHTSVNESTGLLSRKQVSEDHPQSYAHLKGSIAGVYSLTGGAGILLLTKLGGYLFDKLSPGAPFYMLAIFNGILLVVGIGVSLLGG